MSFWKWNGLSPTFTWVGIANYAQLVSDSTVWGALFDNAKWVLLAILPVVLGLALAIALHQGRPKGRGAFRMLYFLPYVLPTVVIAFAWGAIYDPSYGALNALFRDIRLDGLAQNWLGDPHLALVALAMAADWTGFGFCMTLFLAGLGGIDPALYDAARVDGAGPWQRLRHVTLPGLANTTNTVVLVVFINTLRVFDIVFLMTAGGPAGSTDVLGTVLYRQSFQNLNLGYGSAIAVLIVLIAVICTLIFLRIRERTTA